MRKNNTWVFILLPVFVIIIFILLVQNSYLKTISDERNKQIETLQQLIVQQKGQLDEIQKKQGENSDKIDQLDASGKPINPAPQSSGSNAQPRANSSVDTTQRPAQPSNPASPTPAPSNPIIVNPPADDGRIDPYDRPTLLCNPLLPLVCGQ